MLLYTRCWACAAIKRKPQYVGGHKARVDTVRQAQGRPRVLPGLLLRNADFVRALDSVYQS